MEAIFVIIAVLVSVLSGWGLYHLLFDDSDDFMECLGYAFTPDLFSLLKGEWLEDMAQSFKFGVFLWGAVGAGGLSFYGLSILFGGG